MTFALLAAAFLGQKPAPLTPALKAKVIARVGEVLDAKAFVPGKDFSTWPDVVRRHDKALQRAKTSTDFAIELYKALAEYGVSHLFVAPPGTGIGQKVKRFGFDAVRVGDDIVVRHVFAGTQAERAGLRTGMVLSTYWYLDYPKRDRIKVGYKDISGTEHLSVLSTEEFVPKQSPDLVWYDKDAFVLKVPTFSDGYDKKLVETLIHNAAKVPYLLIDLRGNGGGDPVYVEHLLGAFVPAGTRVAAAISKEIVRDFTRRTGKGTSDRSAVVAFAPEEYALIADELKEKYAGRVAVLIDGETGSAAECFALAMREFADVPIFGTRSGGRVLYMNWTALPGGFSLYFPWRDHWSAKGTRLEGNPIVPDVEFPIDSPEGSVLPTPLRTKAVEWLRTKHPIRIR